MRHFFPNKLGPNGLLWKRCLGMPVLKHSHLKHVMATPGFEGRHRLPYAAMSV